MTDITTAATANVPNKKDVHAPVLVKLTSTGNK